MEALYCLGRGHAHAEGLGRGAEARAVPVLRAIGYRPGWGPAPALASARRRQPAAGSTPPRPWCSPVGCWPGARRWRRDLTGQSRAPVTGRGRARSVCRDPFPEPLGRLPRGRLDQAPGAHTVRADVACPGTAVSAPSPGSRPHLQSASVISHVLGVHLSVQPAPCQCPGPEWEKGRRGSGCPGGGVYARLHRASLPRGVQNLDRGGWGGLAAPGDGDPTDQAPALEGLWTW